MSQWPYIIEHRPTLTFWDLTGVPIEVAVEEITKAECVKDGRTIGDDLPAYLQPFWECGEIVSASTDLVTVAFRNRTAYERCSSTDGSLHIAQAIRTRFTEKTRVRVCFRRAA